MTNFARRLPSSLLLLLASLSAGCGGGGGSSGNSSTLSFVSWTGSANGVVVLDANGDDIRFRADTKQMYVGGLTILNARVSGFRVLVDGQDVGTVANVRSTQGNQITALVSLDGFYLDIYSVSGNTVAVEETSRRPAFAATLSGAESMLEADEDFFDFGLGDVYAAEPFWFLGWEPEQVELMADRGQ